MSKICINLCLGRETNWLNSGHPSKTPTPITVSDLYMQCSFLVEKHQCVRHAYELSGTPLPQAVLSPEHWFALKFSSVGGCSLAPRVNASQVKESAFQRPCNCHSVQLEERRVLSTPEECILPPSCNARHLVHKVRKLDLWSLLAVCMTK